MTRARPPVADHTQLNLFQPRPVVPAWSSLPQKTRQQVESKLAALIREYVVRIRNGKDSDD